MALGLWFGAPVVVSAVVPIITLPFLTRGLSPSDYGAWTLAGALGTFAVGIVTPGLHAGFERGFFASTDVGSRARLLYSVVGFAVVALAAAGALAWPWRSDLAHTFLGSSAHGELVMLMFAQSAVTTVKGFYLLHYRGLGDARAYALYSIDEVVLGSILSLWFVIGVRLGPEGLALGQLLAAAFVLVLVASRTAWTIRPQIAAGPLMEALRVSLPLTPRVFVGTLSNQIDKYVVALLDAASGVGVYSLGQRLAFLPFSASNALEHIFVPRVYARMFEGGVAASKEIGRFLTPFAYLTAVVACGVALFAEEALWWLAPAEYSGAAPVATILTLSYALLFFGKLPQLVYAKKTWIASVLSIVTLALNFAFCVFGARQWGALGAAWGVLATTVVSGFLGFVIRQRFYPIGWEYRRLAVVFGLLVLAVASTLVLRDAGIGYVIRLAVKLAMLLFFVGVGVSLGVLSRAQVALLISMVRKPAESAAV